MNVYLWFTKSTVKYCSSSIPHCPSIMINLKKNDEWGKCCSLVSIMKSIVLGYWFKKSGSFFINSWICIIVIFLYSLVVYHSDKIEKKEILKSSIYMLVHNPLTNLFILTGICLMYLLTSKVAGLFFLFSGSLFSLFTIFVVNNTAKKSL